MKLTCRVFGYNPGVKPCPRSFFPWKNPTNRLWSLALGLLLFSGAACVPDVDASPLETATAAPTPSPTETIVWFPPTATHTPFPTFQPSATPESFPGLGNSLYTDDFSDPADWTNARAESQGSNNVLLTGNRLTLSANAAPVTLTSIRTGLVLTDFYAETSVNLNRCSERDICGPEEHAVNVPSATFTACSSGPPPKPTPTDSP